MSSPTRLSDSSRVAIRRLRERREINTVTLHYADPSGVLVPDVEGNLTHDELVVALPTAEPRLVIHELAFASPEGTRRHAHLIILWLPADTDALEETYTAGYSALKEHLADIHVHLTARRTHQLEYRRLVALASG
ncbi:hypothetical protein [Streptomyces yangpuensis]|uniref:hypothetical protein n=1 Tax=Streptomyces yangpuensis TaxID=1648182 RepID=UPI003820F28C